MASVLIVSTDWTFIALNQEHEPEPVQTQIPEDRVVNFSLSSAWIVRRIAFAAENSPMNTCNNDIGMLSIGVCRRNVLYRI